MRMTNEPVLPAHGQAHYENAACECASGGEQLSSDDVTNGMARPPLKKSSKQDGKNASALSLVGRGPDEPQAVRAWRQSESLYRALAERIKAVTYVISLEAGNPVLYVSSQLENFGYPLERWLGQHDFRLQICHEEDRGMLEEILQRSLHGHESICCDYRIRCSNGEIRWVRDEAHVVRDAAGIPLLLQGVIVDTTRDKMMHDELTALRRNLEHQVAHRTHALARRLEILQSCNAVLCERLDDAHTQNDAWRQVKARYDYIMRLPGAAVVFVDQHYKIVDLTEVACSLAGWDRVSAVEHHLLDVFQFTDVRCRSWEMSDHLQELTDEMGVDVCIKYLDGSLVPVRARMTALGTGSSAREYVLNLEKLGSDWSLCGD